MLSFLFHASLRTGWASLPWERSVYGAKNPFSYAEPRGTQPMRARCGPADKQTAADDARLERTASPANAFCNASDATAFFCTLSNWLPCTK